MPDKTHLDKVMEYEQRRVVRGVMQRAENFMDRDTPAHKAIKGALWDWLDLFVIRVKKAVDNDVPSKNNGHAVSAKSGSPDSKHEGGPL